MKRIRRFLQTATIPTILITAALCLNACDRFPQSLKKPNMTALSPRLQPLFARTKTVCFSHFVVEVPATATVLYGPASVDSPIVYFPGDSDKVAQHVAASLGEVEKHRDYLREGSDLRSDRSMFGKVIDGAVPGQKLVFGSKDHATYTIDSFIPLGKDLYVQNADGAIRIDDEIKSLNAFATNLRQRAEDEVPSEPGTCIDGGFVSWQPEFEKVTVGIRLMEFPDVHFSIEVLKNQNYLPDLSDLETRLKGAEKDGGNWYSGVVFFRRGPRQLGDWKGSEALALKPAQENAKESHEFHYISLGAPNAPLQPQLDIQLDTGASGRHMGAVKPSLSNEEAVALWDKLTNSIRARALGGKKSSSSEPPKMPLASLVNTGGICTQTGWWQCSEGDNIEGGRRRHFTTGELMPHAILFGQPNLWQRLTGDRPRHARATVWKLVEYDAEPAAPSPIADESSPLADLAPMPPFPEADVTKDAPPSIS